MHGSGRANPSFELVSHYPHEVAKPLVGEDIDWWAATEAKVPTHFVSNLQTPFSSLHSSAATRLGVLTLPTRTVVGIMKDMGHLHSPIPRQVRPLWMG